LGLNSTLLAFRQHSEQTLLPKARRAGSNRPPPPGAFHLQPVVELQPGVRVEQTSLQGSATTFSIPHTPPSSSVYHSPPFSPFHCHFHIPHGTCPATPPQVPPHTHSLFRCCNLNQFIPVGIHATPLPSKRAMVFHFMQRWCRTYRALYRFSGTGWTFSGVLDRNGASNRDVCWAGTHKRARGVALTDGQRATRLFHYLPTSLRTSAYRATLRGGTVELFPPLRLMLRVHRACHCTRCHLNSPASFHRRLPCAVAAFLRAGRAGTFPANHHLFFSPINVPLPREDITLPADPRTVLTDSAPGSPTAPSPSNLFIQAEEEGRRRAYRQTWRGGRKNSFSPLSPALTLVGPPPTLSFHTSCLCLNLMGGRRGELRYNVKRQHRGNASTLL